MSALGNYIHYHKINYKLYGTNRVGQKSSPMIVPHAETYEKNEINRLLIEAKVLEDEYNKIFYPSLNEINKKTKIFQSSLNKVIQNKLDKEFGLVAGTFNPKTLTVDSNELYSKLNYAINETKNRMGIAQINKQNTAQSLLKQADLLYDILEQQEFKDIVEIKGKIAKTKSQLKSISNRLQFLINETGGGYIKIDNNEDVESLKEIIQQFNRTPLLYKQNKALFEWIAPFIQLKTSDLAKKELRKAMKSLSSEHIKVKVDEERGISDINFNISDNVNIGTFSSDNNTKIIINYTDNGNKLQSKNVITRNISPKTKITLLNQTSLYDLLQMSNLFNFGNHYLNIVTSAKGQKANLGEVYEANRILKSSIITSAIESYEKNNNIEFLIINNGSKRKIYVYSIKILLYLVKMSFNGKDKKYSNIINLSDYYTIPQKFEPTVNQRIGNVLKTVRSKKISGSITPSMLSSYRNLLRTGI